MACVGGTIQREEGGGKRAFFRSSSPSIRAPSNNRRPLREKGDERTDEGGSDAPAKRSHRKRRGGEGERETRRRADMKHRKMNSERSTLRARTTLQFLCQDWCALTVEKASR